MILKFILFSENGLSLFLMKDCGRQAEDTPDQVSEAEFLHKLFLFLAVVPWENHLAFEKIFKVCVEQKYCPAWLTELLCLSVE